MEVEHRKRLLARRDVLLSDLDPVRVLDNLMQAQVCDEDDRQRICSEVTRKDQVRKFLQILPTRGQKAYPTLLEALSHSTGQEHIRQALDEVEVDLEEELEGSDVWEQRAQAWVPKVIERYDGDTLYLSEIKPFLEGLARMENWLCPLNDELIKGVIVHCFPMVIVEHEKRKRKSKRLGELIFRNIRRKPEPYTSQIHRQENDGTDNFADLSIQSSQGDQKKDGPQEESHSSSTRATSEDDGACALEKSSMKHWTVEEVNDWVQTSRLDGKVKTKIQECISDEDIDGEVFESMTESDMKAVLPDLSFGIHRKLLILRNEYLSNNAQVSPLDVRSVTNNHQDGDDMTKATVISNDTSEGKELQAVVRPSLPETLPDESECKDVIPVSQIFRQFDIRSPITLKYKHQTKFPYAEDRPGNLLKPIHRYVNVNLVALEKRKATFVFSMETLKFACACLNDRTNGTIHFGVGDDAEEYGHVKGTELHQDEWQFGDDLVKAIRKTFHQDQHDTVLSCVRPPNFIEVYPHPKSQPTYVIEVDIVPNFDHCKWDAFFMKETEYSEQTQQLTLHKSVLYRCMGGKPEPVAEDALRHFMEIKVKLATARKECEKMPLFEDQAKYHSMRDKLVHLICKGQEFMTGDMYHILVLNSPGETLPQEVFEENFKFLKDIDWKIVFDFDHTGKIFDFLNAEDVLNIIPSLDLFDPRNRVNQNNPDKLRGLHEKVKSSIKPSWIFSNGYHRMSAHEEVLGALEWKQQRLRGLKESIRFLDNEIPCGRALVTYLILSTDYDVMLETADEFFTAFPQQCVSITHDALIGEPWMECIVRKNLVDMEKLEKGTLIGMPWKHVQETIQQIKGPSLSGACQLPTSSGAFCTLKEKIKNSLDDLEILSRNECDNAQIIENKSAFETFMQKAEDNFYKGASVNWWNLWSGKQVLERDKHAKLRHTVDEALSKRPNEDDYVRRVTLYHQPGAGGTTMAHQILWEKRTIYRCAVVCKITDQTRDQILRLWEYEDKKRPKPVLLLLDNLDDDKIDSLRCELEEKAKRITRDREARSSNVVCVLLTCTRQMSLPPEYDSTQIILKQDMSEREQRWFKEVYQKLETDHQEKDRMDPKLMISFNILKENFSETYIKKTVSNCIQKMPSSDEKRILKYVSLLNAFDLKQRAIPTSAFDPIMMRLVDMFAGKLRFSQNQTDPRWENRLSQEIKILLNETSQTGMGAIHALRIIHPSLSRAILRCLAKEQTVSDVAKELFNSTDIFNIQSAACKTLVGIITDLLKLRKRRPNGLPAEKFSPLVEEIIEKESEYQASEVMELGFELTREPFVAQQVSRLYIAMQNWEKATNYAEKATNELQDNSYLWDTRAQIWKGQLLLELQELAIENQIKAPMDAVNMLEKAFKSIDMFKKEQRVCETETTRSPETNLAGYMGEIDVVSKLLEGLQFVHPFHRNLAQLRYFLQQDRYLPPELQCWLDVEGENYVKRLKGMAREVEAAVTRLEDDSTQLRQEVFDEKKKSRYHYLRQKLPELKETLNIYYGEDTDALPEGLSKEEQCNYRRRRVRRLCGQTVGSILHQIKVESGDSLLQRARNLILDNLSSGIENARDLQYIISLNIAILSAQPRFIYQIRLEDMVRWSRRLYELRETISANSVHLEPYLYFVMFNWPRKEMENFGLPPNRIAKAMSQWKEAYFQKYPRQREDRPYRKKDKTMFFLAQAGDMSSIVSYADLRMKESQLSDDDFWRSPRVLNTLQRFQGTLSEDGWEVETTVQYGGGNKGVLSIDTAYPVKKHYMRCNRVYFVIGFSWKCPKAYDISDENPQDISIMAMDERSDSYSDRQQPLLKPDYQLTLPQNELRKVDEQLAALKKIRKSRKLNHNEEQQEERLKAKRERLIRNIYAPEEFLL